MKIVNIDQIEIGKTYYRVHESGSFYSDVIHLQFPYLNPKWYRSDTDDYDIHILQRGYKKEDRCDGFLYYRKEQRFCDPLFDNLYEANEWILAENQKRHDKYTSIHEKIKMEIRVPELQFILTERENMALVMLNENWKNINLPEILQQDIPDSIHTYLNLENPNYLLDEIKRVIATNSTPQTHFLYLHVEHLNAQCVNGINFERELFFKLNTNIIWYVNPQNVDALQGALDMLDWVNYKYL